MTSLLKPASILPTLNATEPGRVFGEFFAGHAVFAGLLSQPGGSPIALPRSKGLTFANRVGNNSAHYSIDKLKGGLRDHRCDARAR
ncbi:hypothetical protein ACWD6N_33985 [Micromonospora sp. NPDC005163]